jgi:hypothetical protein
MLTRTLVDELVSVMKLKSSLPDSTLITLVHFTLQVSLVLLCYSVVLFIMYLLASFIRTLEELCHPIACCLMKWRVVRTLSNYRRPHLMDLQAVEARAHSTAFDHTLVILWTF